MNSSLEAHLLKFGLASAAALFLVSPAAAQDYRGVAFAGGSVGDGASVYAGSVISLPGARLGKGFGLRASVNAGEYRYQGGPGRIEAQYKGAEAALVYQLSGGWGWANLSAGPRVADTSLSPDDPANERRGTRWDVGLQTDGAVNLDPQWRLGWLGSVGVRDGAFQTRLALGHLVEPKSQTRIGVEAAIQGDPRYTTLSGGVFVSRHIAKDLEAQISVGAADQEGRSLQPYGSIGFSVLF